MNDIKNTENEEVLNERNPRLNGVHPLFLYILAGAIALITLAVVLIVNSGNAQDTRVEATTLSVTESIAETTIMPTTEETIHTEPTEPSETIPEGPDPNDIELLACVIYQEAGSDKCCDDCRRRVADVVLNRVASERFPNQDTIYDVLMRQGQYGRFHWTGVVWPERASYETEKHAVERAYRIAEEVLRGNHSELYEEGYVWQAEFKQGKDIIYHCNIYFGR
jgi:hypothetical protein